MTSDCPDPSPREKASPGGDLLDLLLEILTRAAKPISEQDLPARGDVVTDLVVLLSNRCVRLYRAIYVLLEDNSPEEARALLRSLIAEAHVLVYLARRPGRRQELAFRYLHTSLRADIAVHRDAAAAVFGPAKSRWVDGAEQFLADLERQAAENGITKLRAFPGTADILTFLDQKHVYWAYQVGSNSVHGSYMALMAYRGGDEYPAMFRWDGPIDSVVAVAQLAGELLLAVLGANAVIMEWPNLDEVMKTRADLVKRLAECADATLARA